MSDTSNTPTVEELQSEIDRLNRELATKGSSTAPASSATPADTVNVKADNGPGVVREPGSGATVIGAAPDPRGGTVLGHSDGTVTLVGVPVGSDGNTASPWGSAPDGDYTQFYVDDNGNRYNWVSSDGKTVQSVDNPNQVRA